MKLRDIDYTPLQGMHKPWLDALNSVLPYAVIVVAVILGMILAGDFGWMGAVAFLLVSGIAGAKIQSHKEKAWRNFAKANEWYIIPKPISGRSLVPPGIIGEHLRGQKISDIVHAQFEGHECDLFIYEFSTGKGSKRRVHYYTVARVLLARPFPHLILDSKKTWALRHTGSATAKVSLEGDFDKHFSLYFNPGEHIDALSIITPDVMQTLIDFNQAQDIEIIGPYLFFITASDHRTYETLPALIASVDALADEIAHKAKSIRYTPLGGMHGDMLAEAVAQSFKSNARVMNGLSLTFLFMLILPFLLFGLAGMMMFLLNR